MNRFEVTTAESLKVGDRFYKASDKNKQPLVKVEPEGKTLLYCEAFVYDHPTLDSQHKAKNYKTINKNVQVVFLRHKEDATA